MTSHASDQMQKGRILRVKQGYNPNSSSMGSMIFVLPASMLAATVCFGVISGAIMAAALKRKDNASQDADAPAKKEEPES